MKTFRKLLLTILLFNSGYIFAQNISVNIGKSTTSSLTKNKPSQIIATFPENDTLKNSWLVDGFLELKFNDVISNYNFGIVSELHKNNLIGKEQDVLQFSFTVEKDYLFYDKKDQLFFRIISSSNLKYSNNKIKEKKELQGNLGFTLSLEKSDKLRFLQPNTKLINIKSLFAKFFTLSHNHNFGLGYIGGEENVLLGDASFGLTLFPLSGFTYKFKQPELFQISWNVNARTPILGNTDIDLNTLQTLSIGFSYKINDKSSAGIAYSWQEGANPYTRLENQTFETIFAKLKLTIE